MTGYFRKSDTRTKISMSLHGHLLLPCCSTCTTSEQGLEHISVITFETFHDTFYENIQAQCANLRATAGVSKSDDTKECEGQ